jgi:PAS domain S-box-containing protein
VSRRWRNDYGLGDRDLFRVSHYEVFPEVTEQWKEAHRRGLAGEILQAEADRFERSDGSVRWVRWEIRPWYSAGDVGGIVIFTEDITERKLAEEELRQSEDRFRTMADAIPQLAWVAHADGFIYWYNRQWYEYTGMTPEQMEGWGWQSVHDPKMLTTVLNQWKASITTGEPFEMVFPLQGGDGQFRQFLTRVQPLKDAQGKIVQWFGTNTDITEIKRAEDALQKLNEELEMRVAQRTEELEEALKELKAQNEEMQEAHHALEVETAERIRILEELRQKEQILIQQSRLAAMGEMLGYIAHQWRQPLNLLALNVQELGLSYKHGSFCEELLDQNLATAMKIIQHLSRTIDDFRDFLILNKEKRPFKVDQVIVKTINLIEENFKGQGISIDVSSTGDPQINGYQNEYNQVLLNLMMNAKDAFLEHGVSDARIAVRSWAENGRTVVTITDNAGGIQEVIIDKIFDAYFTTKELGKGSGVGLFMSKMIIEKNMGGRLSVRNVDGGAEFRIEV